MSRDQSEPRMIPEAADRVRVGATPIFIVQQKHVTSQFPTTRRVFTTQDTRVFDRGYGLTSTPTPVLATQLMFCIFVLNHTQPRGNELGHLETKERARRSSDEDVLFPNVLSYPFPFLTSLPIPPFPFHS